MPKLLNDKISVLLTRPVQSSFKLKEQLAARNFTIYIEPLLKYKLIPAFIKSDRCIQAILITSQQAAYSFNQISTFSHIPVWTVGDQTAAAAKEAGFAQVLKGGDTVASLLIHLNKVLKPEDGQIIYLAGKLTHADIVSNLSQKGFTVEKHVVYEAEYAKELTLSTYMALKNCQIQTCLFFSQETARTFTKIVRILKDVDTSDCTAFCLSAQVAYPLNELKWRNIVWCAQPTWSQMIKMLEEWRNDR